MNRVGSKYERLLKKNRDVESNFLILRFTCTRASFTILKNMCVVSDTMSLLFLLRRTVPIFSSERYSTLLYSCIFTSHVRNYICFERMWEIRLDSINSLHSINAPFYLRQLSRRHVFTARIFEYRYYACWPLLFPCKKKPVRTKNRFL